jgi:hypothetical protein
MGRELMTFFRLCLFSGRYIAQFIERQADQIRRAHQPDPWIVNKKTCDEQHRAAPDVGAQKPHAQGRESLLSQQRVEPAADFPQPFGPGYGLVIGERGHHGPQHGRVIDG